MERERSNNRLLVVDDEGPIVQAYLDFLAPRESSTPRKSSRSGSAPAAAPSTSGGYEILKAHNGKEAVEVFRKEFEAGRRIAGGFFDVKMEGGIDGIQAIQEIWKIDPEIHCTLVTAYHDRDVDDIDQLFGDRFKDQWDYLNKPFTQAEIVQKARQMIAAWGRKRSLEQALEQVKAAQDKLVQSERLAAIGQVARGIHHEFGNFLQTIIGQADLALHQKDLEKIREKLTTIIHAGEHASLIVRNLQSFSKATAAKSRVEIGNLLSQTLLLLNHEFKKKLIKVTEQKKPSSFVQASAPEIEQVFLNLLINSIHAMPNGGTIEVGCQDDATHVVAWVRDSGTGIPAEILPRVFDHAFTTKGDQGSGLGLAICKEIIESHQGTILIETAVGKGTTFKIRLPRASG